MVQGREHRMTEVFARLAPGATLNRRGPSCSTVYGAMLGRIPMSTSPKITSRLP